jgi:hypothetical protein
VLILPMLFGAFQPPSPHRRPRYSLSLGPRTKKLVASCNIRRLHLHSRRPYRHALHVRVTIKCGSQQILLSGFGGRKAPSSMGKLSTAGVLRLRATSAVSRDKSVRRCAQDDDSVGELTERRPLCGSGAHRRSLGLPNFLLVLVALASFMRFSPTEPHTWMCIEAAWQETRLRSPGFLLRFVALMHFMRLSLRKGAHAALSSAAWQESGSG